MERAPARDSTSSGLTTQLSLALQGALQQAYLPSPIDDASLGQIVRRQFNRHLVTRKNTDVVLAHFPGNMRCHDMPVLELYSKSGVWKCLGNDAFHLDGFFFCQGLKVSVREGPRIVQKWTG